MEYSPSERNVIGAISINCLIILLLSLNLIVFFFNSSIKPSTYTSPPPDKPNNTCTNRYIYIHDLPTKFNSDLITACHNLSKWTDMCSFTTNSGLGFPIQNSDSLFSEKGWYNTNQFMLELIFHSRMKNYPCLTSNSSLASAIYVPYYAGLDIGRYLWGYNSSVRDHGSKELVQWVKSQPQWTRMGGRDHFFVGGRVTWDFRRVKEDDKWGNNLLFMEEVRNMTVLVVESSPWHSNDVGIPYPTYFHPSSKVEVLSWQERMRKMERPWLFSFAGAPRPGMKGSIRGELIEQCRRSKRCSLVECHKGASKCHLPSTVMRTFQRSVFCLQPQGDSYTRRSVFDAMLAGCIPVFFHPGTAYVQYLWHLPKDYGRYSVFITEDEVREGKVKVEDVLERYGEEEVRRMREEVVRMIPGLVYSDPRVEVNGVEDAFDVAIEGVLEKIRRVRENRSLIGLDEEHNSWKRGVGVNGPHDWDRFFFKIQK